MCKHRMGKNKIVKWDEVQGYTNWTGINNYTSLWKKVNVWLGCITGVLHAAVLIQSFHSTQTWGLRGPFSGVWAFCLEKVEHHKEKFQWQQEHGQDLAHSVCDGQGKELEFYR